MFGIKNLFISRKHGICKDMILNNTNRKSITKIHKFLQLRIWKGCFWQQRFLPGLKIWTRELIFICIRERNTLHRSPGWFVAHMKYCVLGSFWLCQAQWEIGHRCYLLFGCHPSLFALPVTQPWHQKLSMEHSSGPAQIAASCFSHFPPSAWMDWHLLEAIKTFEG